MVSLLKNEAVDAEPNHKPSRWFSETLLQITALVGIPSTFAQSWKFQGLGLHDQGGLFHEVPVP